MTLCREQFAECEEAQERALRDKEKKLDFSDMERALKWIDGHRDELAIGTVVLVAGAAFVLTVSPVGWLVLVPVAAAS
ncbi:hypothetical protein [Archangium primigenium]|uniref:hypothetical protein n=1 Tax=[Archangium] primigenium TaxID=2792470 RepID=UPI001957562F|nr:hypothetical protein [Archangium primigenium]MBM7112904.1 hypothetical protein [Archangium primigenium]